MRPPPKRQITGLGKISLSSLARYVLGEAYRTGENAGALEKTSGLGLLMTVALQPYNASAICAGAMVGLHGV
jgi:hypothetical protein